MRHPIEAHPDARELRALRELDIGTPELLTVPGVGDGTVAALITKRWIIAATTDVFGRPRYLLTNAGEAARRRGLAPKIRKATRLKSPPPRLGAMPTKLKAPPRR